MAAVKAPRYGEERRKILSDLAVSTGATFVTREKDLTLAKVKLEHFGTAKKVDVTRGITTVVDGWESLRYTRENSHFCETKFRLLKLCKKARNIKSESPDWLVAVAIIRVGASTEVEMIEKRHRLRML